jgi:hypothetical protein
MHNSKKKKKKERCSAEALPNYDFERGWLAFQKKKKKFVSVCEKNNVAAFFRCHNKSQLFAMWFFVKPNGKKEI